jgi:amino acid permease
MVEINSIEMVQDMTMKKGKLLFVATTILYMLCGCIGYASFGDNAPEKLVEAANAAIAIHSVVAYQCTN